MIEAKYAARSLKTRESRLQYTLSTALLQVLLGEQEWEKAEVQARSMSANNRGASLYDVVRALTRAQQWQRAETLAYSIDDPHYRGHALLALVWCLAPSTHARW